MHRHRPTVSVPCEPLSSIMSRTGYPNATLLSLDVEGAEDLVLGTASPSAFQVILVESDGFDCSREQRAFYRHGRRLTARYCERAQSAGPRLPPAHGATCDAAQCVDQRNAMYPRPTLKELSRALRSTY